MSRPATTSLEAKTKVNVIDDDFHSWELLLRKNLTALRIGIIS